MNTRFLEAFVWAARLGSFKAAAGKLHLTQAAISGRIAGLEEEFGQRLFDRGPRDLRLTTAGHTMLVHAERMLELDRAMHEALRGPQALHGRVRLGVVESVVHTWMAPFIQRVNEAHSALELELTVEPTARLHELLQRGQIDAALQTDPVLGDDIRNRELGRLRMAWVTPREGLCASQAEPIDVAAGAVITFTRGSQPHLAVLSAFERAGVHLPQVHCVTSIAAITRLLDISRGVATLPLAAVEHLVASGDYRVIDPGIELPDLTLVASHRPDPVHGLPEALVEIASDEMRRFAAGTTAAWLPA